MMRGHRWQLVGTAAVMLAAAAGLSADDKEDVARKQKDAAIANWKQLYNGDAPTYEETGHLLIVGPTSMTPRQFRELGASLERQFSTARSALGVKPSEELWTGKLTVYLITERSIFNTFMRTIAKKKPTVDDSGVFFLRGEQPLVAASPPQTRRDPSLEAQAGEQLAAAILSKRGGDGLPEWLVAGFSRATAWRANPSAYSGERQQVKRLLARGYKADDVWGGKLTADEAPVLRASLADFLAYGPGAKYFTKLLEGFKPDQTQRPKTTLEALKSVRNDYAEVVSTTWPGWALKGR
jgi:hypothetical protein